MKNLQGSLKQLGILAGILAVIWTLGMVLPFRLDLTEEKRYSLHPASIAVLEGLEEPIEIDILLAGELPGGMRRLQRSVEENIRIFNSYSNKRITYRYFDPLDLPKQDQEDFIVGLADFGINPTNLYTSESGGQQTKMIFPGILARNAEFEVGALILKGEANMGPDEILNQSVENLEFELINAIKRLVTKQEKEIGLIVGHGEMSEDEGFGIVEALADDYQVYKVPLEQAKTVDDLLTFDILMVVGPKSAYQEREIYLLDQFLMRGGNLIFLLDPLAYTFEEAGGDGTVAMPFDHGLDQMLFRYGVRVNKDFVQDINFGYHVVMGGNFGNQQQMVPLPWPFYVAAGAMAKHPITKGLDQIVFRFSGSLDTVKADGVVKTPLVFGSEFGRKLPAPVRLAFADMEQKPDLKEFNQRSLPLIYLLEGNFNSLFKNRFLPEGADKSGFIPEGNQGRVLVAGTGQLFQSSKSPLDGNPLLLGQDPFSEIQYANRQLLQNAVNYLVDPGGIIATRTKQFQIRPLNKVKVEAEKAKWQAINTVVPAVIFALFGIGWVAVRKRKFAKK
jgi:gliding-associated putative ABC transporter substrate-binding component GldG